jgi:HEAT repeat protein
MDKPAARCLVVMGALSVALCVGCADGPFRRLWYGKEWQQDEQYGATYHQRTEELQAIRRNASSYRAEEQSELARKMNDLLAQERGSCYRGELVLTLGELRAPEAVEGLRRAIKDNDPKVRIAACEAWARRGDDEAVRLLTEAVSADADLDVRTAATRELARFRRPEAIKALGVALDDPDPALQHRAVLSLRSVTGRDLGNSVADWRQFVREGAAPQPQEPTLAERWHKLF